MEDYDNINNDLLRRIDAFFECQLSEEEELALCKDLLDTSFTHPAVNEALSVMGFRTARRYLDPPLERRKCGQERLPRRRFAWIAAAGIVAIVATIAFLYPSSSSTDGSFIAFVNGERITSEEEVLNIMRLNMNEFEDGVNDAESDIFSELDIIVYDNEE